MLAPANRPPPVVTFPLRDDELGVCDTLPDRNSTGATTRITNATDQESLKTPQSVIVSWNIGLRGLRQLTDPLKPFDQQTSKDEHGVTRAKGYGSVQNLLQSLGQHVNVVCLQETKLGSAHDLTAETATPKGWDSFFSICRLTQRGKSGYAGVCVYFRKELMVLSAEEGITGVLSGAAGDAVGVGAEESESDADDVDPDPPKADPGKRDTRRASTASHKMRSRFTLDRMRELDAEGRCLVVDFGRFVLINVYVPAVTSSDPVEGARCVSQIPPPC
jgi:AP endonuclease-2